MRDLLDLLWMESVNLVDFSNLCLFYSFLGFRLVLAFNGQNP